jgi:hypothetical protein
MQKRETIIFLAVVGAVAVLFMFNGYVAQAQKVAAPLPRVVPAAAQPFWVTANQGTFTWDAVTQLADGTPIPATAIVKYQTWRRKYSVSAGETVGDPITATRATLSFPEGQFLVGVQSLRYEGVELVAESGVAWSDDPTVCKDGVTFGFRHFVALMTPVALRPTQ